MNTRIATVLLLLACAGPAVAAVGCTLNEPDRDVVRLFPDATNYRTEFIAIDDRGGGALARRLEAALGDSLDPVYEALDVPYAYYTVLAGSDTLGRIHGVNQRGEFGGMQIILATDPEGRIIELYYQRLSSPQAGLFRDPLFTDQFKGLDLDDFCRYARSGDGPVAAVEDPTDGGSPDFAATLRGATKNLFLMNSFHRGVGCPDATGGGSDEGDDAR